MILRRKRNLAIMLFAMIVFAVSAGTAFLGTRESAKAEASAIYIYNAEQLIEFSQQTQPESSEPYTYRNTPVHLMADINLNNVYWKPIMNFNDYFFGNGFTISNFIIEVNNEVTSNSSNFGFFDVLLYSAIVKDLTISHVQVKLGNVVQSSRENIGILVGHNSASIHNCHIKYSSISIPRYSANYMTGVGGIAGVNNRDIVDCTVKDSAFLGWGELGGIVGVNYNIIDGCEFNGTIYAFHEGINSDFGGIAAFLSSSGMVSNCSSAGSIIYASAKREGNISISPSIGYIIGASFGSYGYNSSTMTIDSSNLVSFKTGIFASFDQAMYVAKLDGGRVGR